MSNDSSLAQLFEGDSDNDSMDDNQAMQFLEEKDPEWVELCKDEDEIDLKPKISIEERVRLADEKEKEMIRKAKARGMAKIPDDYVPSVVTPKETAEENTAKYDAWCEKIKRIDREKQEWVDTNKNVARAEYEKYAKLQKEYRTRDYYWKPDPLYFLHMKELGYSKIAIEKALFYTDNTSVAKAVEYLKENPNPSELTKEEVMEAGEEVLKKYRPVSSCKQGDDGEVTSKEVEMEVEDANHELIFDDGSSVDVKYDSESEEDIKVTEVISKKDPYQVTTTRVQDHVIRGVKRTYIGEEVTLSRTSTSSQPSLPYVDECAPDYRMIFIINTSLLMDAITLSLEVGKVVATITTQMKWEGANTMVDRWIQEGSKMAMYKGMSSDHLQTTYKRASDYGLHAHMGHCSQYRNVKSPCSTVLGIFGETAKLSRLHAFLEML